MKADGGLIFVTLMGCVLCVVIGIGIGYAMGSDGKAPIYRAEPYMIVTENGEGCELILRRVTDDTPPLFTELPTQ